MNGVHCQMRTTAIDHVEATKFGSNVGFVVNVDSAVRVLVLFRDSSAPVNGSIKWKAVELAQDTGNPSRWTGGSPIVGDNIEWIVQAVTQNGNVATSHDEPHLVVLPICRGRAP